MRNRDTEKERTVREKALELIVRDGFDGFSMQKLAKEAGVSAATAYIYFENKEDLLHRLYTTVQEAFTDYCLQGFDENMPLADGLRVQWKNRLRFVQELPVYYRFMEQFRASPLIDKKENAEHMRFKQAMSGFVKNAVARKEVSVAKPELFWAIAYGPFYTLVNFHMRGESMMGMPFSLSDALVEELLERTIRAIGH